MVDETPAKTNETNEELGDTGRLARLNVAEPESSTGEVEVTEEVAPTPVVDEEAEDSATEPAAEEAPSTPAADMPAGEGAVEAAAQNEDAAAAQGEGTSEFREVPQAVQSGGSHLRRNIVFAVVACAIVGGIAFAILTLPGYGGAPTVTAAPIESESASRATMFADVTIPVAVPELDDTGSRIPLHIDGQDADGSSRNEIVYATFEGKTRLPVGIYSVRVAETPISGKGLVYEIPHDELTVSVDAGKHVSVTPKDKVLTFTVAHPQSVLDSKIDQAKELIKADPEKKDQANKLAKLVVARRKQAVAAIAQNRKNMQSAELDNAGDEERDEEDKDKDEGQNNGGGSGGNDNKSSNQPKSQDSGSKSKESAPEQQGGGDQGGNDAPAPGDSSGGGQEQQPTGGESDAGGQSQDGGQAPSDSGGDTGASGGDGGTEGAGQPAEQPPAGGDQPAA